MVDCTMTFGDLAAVIFPGPCCRTPACAASASTSGRGAVVLDVEGGSTAGGRDTTGSD